MRRRAFIASVAGAAFAGIASGRAPTRYDAVVSLSPRPAGDAPRYPTVGKAIAAAPADGERPFRILVERGLWREKLVVDRPNVHLIGADREASVLSFDVAARDPGADGQPLGTWGCASVIVRAPGFAARKLTIENAFDYVGELQRLTTDLIGPNGLQAVALMLAAGSDRAAFDAVTLRGHQDTLFVDAGRSLFRDCHIAGSVDFVFGGGQAWFERCELHSRHRPGRDARQGYIAVPSTSVAQEFGLVFADCRLTRDAAIPDGSVVLGRAWRPTRTFADGRYGDTTLVGAATYLHCWMDAHIGAEGWDPMGYTARDGTRVMFDPIDARLFEHASRGPGAIEDPRRRRLGAAQAARCVRARVLGGWEPEA